MSAKKRRREDGFDDVGSLVDEPPSPQRRKTLNADGDIVVVNTQSTPAVPPPTQTTVTTTSVATIFDPSPATVSTSPVNPPPPTAHTTPTISATTTCTLPPEATLPPTATPTPNNANNGKKEKKLRAWLRTKQEGYYDQNIAFLTQCLTLQGDTRPKKFSNVLRALVGVPHFEFVSEFERDNSLAANLSNAKRHYKVMVAKYLPKGLEGHLESAMPPENSVNELPPAVVDMCEAGVPPNISTLKKLAYTLRRWELWREANNKDGAGSDSPPARQSSKSGVAVHLIKRKPDPPVIDNKTMEVSVQAININLLATMEKFRMQQQRTLQLTETKANYMKNVTGAVLPAYVDELDMQLQESLAAERTLSEDYNEYRRQLDLLSSKAVAIATVRAGGQPPPPPPPSAAVQAVRRSTGGLTSAAPPTTNLPMS